MPICTTNRSVGIWTLIYKLYWRAYHLSSRFQPRTDLTWARQSEIRSFWDGCDSQSAKCKERCSHKIDIDHINHVRSGFVGALRALRHLSSAVGPGDTPYANTKALDKTPITGKRRGHQFGAMTAHVAWGGARGCQNIKHINKRIYVVKKYINL